MKHTMKFVSFLLCLVLIIGIMPVASANAASKPILDSTQMTISLGTSSYAKVYIGNKNSSAKYTFTSSDKSIVTVNKEGVLTGNSYGTAKITVKQILKKKTTTVGTCKVTVVKSTIIDYGDGWLIIGKDVFAKEKTNLDTWELINYRVPSAVYTYYSNDKELLTIKKDGSIVETKKAGKVTVTVKETYKKKTRTVGKYTIDIKSPTLTVENNVLDIGVGEKFSIYDCFAYYSGSYYVETKDNDQDENNDPVKYVYDEDGKWNSQLTGASIGTMTVSIYLGKEKTDTNLLGTFTVNVKEFPATGVNLYSEEVCEYDINDSDADISFSVEPYNCTDTIVITSSDPSIASVNPVSIANQDDSYKEIPINLNKIGTTTINIKVGTFTKEIKVVVYDSEETY